MDANEYLEYHCTVNNTNGTTQRRLERLKIILACSLYYLTVVILYNMF